MFEWMFNQPQPGYVVTTSNKTTMYPCDRGTGQALGFHHFEMGPYRIAVCIYCGKKADND